MYIMQISKVSFSNEPGTEHLLLGACIIPTTRSRREYIHMMRLLGKGGYTKSDEFSEIFQTTFGLPHIFGKLCCKFFMIDMVEKPVHCNEMMP